MAKDASKNVPDMRLIPWDPESEEQIQRLILQRIACGWNSELVKEPWVELQKSGHKYLFWIVIMDENSRFTELLQKHLDNFPGEKEELVDTAMSIGGKRISPSTDRFVPIGHISIDTSQADSNGKLSYGVPGALSISCFYVSKSLRGTGIGSRAMDELEEMAVKVLGAKTLVLGTAADEWEGKIEKHKHFGRKLPKFSVAKWYERRGYVPYKWIKEAYPEPDSDGKIWWTAAVFLKKDIV